MSRQTGLVAFILGAAAGGIAAVLMAPDRGSRTRQRIREGARHAFQEGTEAARDATDTVAEKARQQVDAVKSAVQEGSEAYRREFNRSKEDK